MVVGPQGVHVVFRGGGMGTVMEAVMEAVMVGEVMEEVMEAVMEAEKAQAPLPSAAG